MKPCPACGASRVQTLPDGYSEVACSHCGGDGEAPRAIPVKDCHCHDCVHARHLKDGEKHSLVCWTCSEDRADRERFANAETLPPPPEAETTPALPGYPEPSAPQGCASCSLKGRTHHNDPDEGHPGWCNSGPEDDEGVGTVCPACLPDWKLAEAEFLDAGRTYTRTATEAELRDAGRLR